MKSVGEIGSLIEEGTGGAEVEVGAAMTGVPGAGTGECDGESRQGPRQIWKRSGEGAVCINVFICHFYNLRTRGHRR